MARKQASNSYATAVYPGVRGNDLKIVIQVNPDDETMYDVQTLLDSSVVDEQTVSAASELVNNSYVAWKSGWEIAETAATPLEGGANGEVSGGSHQA